ncbi:MAG: sulfotransferase domain-containing protein [Geobacter sp.]|nr:sulfotransferase domain-containing protein [Geobacter sp.]
MNGIIWLASYPKSGNTWFRIFLANLLRDCDTPVSINELENTPIASARILFDENIGFESSDLTADEIDRIRPELYCHLAKDSDTPLFMKVHDACTLTDGNIPLFPAAATAGAIYFIRNPLDVAVSFAHHNGTGYDAAIASMADDSFSLCGKNDRLYNQLRQKLHTWSNHVQSWLDNAPFPVCLLSYEDMKTNPQETFTRAVRFAGLDFDQVRIEKAIRFSAFEAVRQQEEAEGFQEKSASSKRFFRKGVIGSWLEELTIEQMQQIVTDHGPVMRRFGYLTKNGEIALDIAP